MSPRVFVAIVTCLCVIPACIHGQVSVVIDGNGDVIPYSSSVDYCTIKDQTFTFYSREDCLLDEYICNGTGRGKGLDKPVCHVVIHNTHLPNPPACDPSDCCNVVRAIQQHYIDMGGCDLPFHFMIDADGNMYEGKGYNKIGAHVSDRDLRCKSYGFSFLEQPLTEDAKAAFYFLIYCGRQMACVNYEYDLCAHSSIPTITDSTCPGPVITAEVATWPDYNCTNFGEEVCCKCEDINQVCGTTSNIGTGTTCVEEGEGSGGAKVMLNGGHAPKANDKQYPFVVIHFSQQHPKHNYYMGRVYVSSKLLCTGSIIHCQYILTAAHCVEGKAWADVWVGSTTKKAGTKYTARVIEHEDYAGGGDDIALLKLKKPIPEWTDAIRPICLPTRSGESYAGTTVTIAGWGFIEPAPEVFPNCLRHTDLPVLTDAAVMACFTLHADQFGAGACDKTLATFTGGTNGDSGGPMFLKEGGKYIVIGVNEANDYDGITTATDVFHHMTNWDPLKAVADEIAVCPQS